MRNSTFFLCAFVLAFFFVGSVISISIEERAIRQLLPNLFEQESPNVRSSSEPIPNVKQQNNPMFIVSGLTASALEARLYNDKPPHAFCPHNTEGWYDVWPFQNSQLAGPLLDCYLHNFEILYNPDNASAPYYSNFGVDVRAKYFGTAGPNSSSWIQNVAEYLVPLGYTADVNMFGLAYDWRLDGRGSAVNSTDLPFGRSGDFENFARLIEETVANNGGHKAHMIGHSYGGPVIHNFLTKYVSSSWKQANIASFISLSGPFLGTPGAPAIVITNGSVYGGSPIEEKIYSVIGRFPAIVELMPSEKLTPTKGPLAAPVVVTTPDTQYYSKDLESLLNDGGSTQDSAIRSANFDAYNTLNPPEVPTLCLYGSGLDSPATFTFADDNFQDYTGSGYSDGDSAILEGSLASCKEWDGKQKGEVIAQDLPGADHNSILDDDRTWDYVGKWLKAHSD